MILADINLGGLHLRSVLGDIIVATPEQFIFRSESINQINDTAFNLSKHLIFNIKEHLNDNCKSFQFTHLTGTVNDVEIDDSNPIGKLIRFNFSRSQYQNKLVNII